VPHSSRPAPSWRVLDAINVEIAALMRTTGGSDTEQAARMARYHELVAEYVDVRLGGGERGREGEDDEEWAA